MNTSKKLVANRYEMMRLEVAENCNPGGDPNANNAPRTIGILDQYGVITDVSHKREIRDYITAAYGHLPGYEVMIQQGASINKAIAEAVFEANDVDRISALPNTKDGPVNLKTKESAAIMTNRYIDVRTFGGVLSTGLNAGQVTGPVQVAMSKSYHPIEIEDLTITRMAYTESPKNPETIEDFEKEERERPDDVKRTFGQKWIVPFELYPRHYTVSAYRAQQTGFTEEDLERMFEAIVQTCDFNVSSSKFGRWPATPLIIFKHIGTQGDANSEQNTREAMLGCAPAQYLFNMIQVKQINPGTPVTSIDDFEITLDLSKLPNGVEIGAKTFPFEPVAWGKEAVAAQWNYNIIW